MCQSCSALSFVQFSLGKILLFKTIQNAFKIQSRLIDIKTIEIYKDKLMVFVIFVMQANVYRDQLRLQHL